jgi:hypothetical protein
MALKIGTGDNVLQLTPSTPPPLWRCRPLCYRKGQRHAPWSSNHEIQPGEQINSKVVKVNGRKEPANYPRLEHNQNDHHILRTHQKNMCIERLSVSYEKINFINSMRSTYSLDRLNCTLTISFLALRNQGLLIPRIWLERSWKKVPSLFLYARPLHNL